MAKKILLTLLYPVIVIGSVLIIWAIGAAATDNALTLPTPGKTFAELIHLLGVGKFWRAFFGTLLRSLLGFVLSMTGAAGLTALAAAFRPARKILTPLVSVVRAVPTMAAVLLLTLWVSASAVPVVVALLVILPTLYASFYGALTSVDPRLIEMSAAYGVPMGKRIIRLYLPAVAPAAVEAAAGAISLNLKLVIAAEILAQTARSLGSLMQLSNIYLETAQLMALTVVAVLTALALEYGVKGLGALLLRRKPANKRGRAAA